MAAMTIFAFFSGKRGLGLFGLPKPSVVESCGGPDEGQCPKPGGPACDYCPRHLEDRPMPAEAATDCDCDDDECDAPEPNYAERERQRHAENIRAHLQRVTALAAVRPVNGGGVTAAEAKLADNLAKCVAYWAGDNGVSLPHALGLLSMAKARIEANANFLAKLLD